MSDDEKNAAENDAGKRATDEIPTYKPTSSVPPAPKTIQEATSFDGPDGLFEILRGMGTIRGTPNPRTGAVTTYTAEEVIETITKMRSGEEGLQVTRTEGLRKKVGELLTAERNQ